MVEQYSNFYFHLFLIKQGKEVFGQYNFDNPNNPAGMSYSEYLELYRYYVYNYRGYSVSDVEVIAYKGVGSGINKSQSVRDYAIELVKQGIPVKLGIGNNYDSDTGSHAVVAYDYNEEKDELYCHFGWGENTTHITIESLGYTSYNNLFGFNFNNPHSHSNNYKYSNEYNVNTRCSCNYVIPFNIDIIEGNYRDSLPTYKWNCLNKERWFKSQDLKYKFSILNSSRHALFEAVTPIDEYELTQGQWNQTLALSSNYYAYVEPYSETEVYWDDYGYAELFFTTSSFKNAHVITPVDYGFADAYPTDSSTMNNYTSHTVNGFTFNTKRYRTGYIHNEYIVLSPIRQNINEAFIEYKFNSPVLRIDVQLAHWRSYSNEHLSNSNGTFSLELLTSNGWVATYNLLSSEYNLPTDRNNPNWYTFEFEQPVYEFRFHATSSYVTTAETNRGRVCIGDLAIWTHLPLSGYELEYDETLWSGIPSYNNNCYAYALNNQIDPRNSQIWFKQQPGEFSGNPNRPFTREVLIPSVSADFDEYNKLYNTNLIFKEVGRFEVCPKGTYKVALVAYDGDYHWYRQNADGTWSHKPGTTPVRNYDNSGDVIIDPQFCDRGNYVNFLGYFAVTPWGNMYET